MLHKAKYCRTFPLRVKRYKHVDRKLFILEDPPQSEMLESGSIILAEKSKQRTYHRMKNLKLIPAAASLFITGIVQDFDSKVV